MKPNTLPQQTNLPRPDCPECGATIRGNACNCIPEAEALETLAYGYDAWMVHDACIEFAIPSGVITFWHGSYDYPHRWTLEGKLA